MLTGLPSLIDSIFGKQDLSSVSLDEIRDVITEFPSFNAAHYLLSKKLKQLNEEAYEKETMRTALYFNNALWLQTILDSEEKEILRQSKSASPQFSEIGYDDADPVLLSPAFSDTAFTDPEISEPVKVEFPETVLETSPVFESVPEHAEESYSLTEIHTKEDKIADIEKLVEEISAKVEQIVEPKSEYVSEYGIFEESSDEGKYLDNDSFDRPTDHSHSGENHVDLRIESEKPEENETIVEQNIVESPVEDSIDYDAEAFDRRPEPLESYNESVNYSDNESETVVQHEELPPPEQPPVHTPRVFEAKNAESIVFAPYHMVDYFASQGIKLVLEDQPADSFGKQLKSFTDWLKVMKKVPVKTRIDKSDDGETDRIRHFASNSLEERDILTESMAEVLAKQGMYENAIALYQKLSLIYPPKSVYFASRIEQLKASLP